MPSYRIVVTDVTQYGTLFCVAGWDVQNGGMIRPEPHTTTATSEASRFWGDPAVGQGKVFDVGRVLEFQASLPPADFPFPHATEDRLVAPNTFVLLDNWELTKMVGAVSAGISDSLAHAFGGHLVRANSGKAYVLAGQNTNSLGAVEIEPGQIEFFEDGSTGKRRLRALVTDGCATYDLTVPAWGARGKFLAGGVNAVQADANKSTRIHLRVGLARAFADAPCYAQINGIFFL